jgi:hypothetical protein
LFAYFKEALSECIPCGNKNILDKETEQERERQKKEKERKIKSK